MEKAAKLFLWLASLRDLWSAQGQGKELPSLGHAGL